MHNFIIGDLVIRKHKTTNNYSITNDKTICEVIRVNGPDLGNNNMCIKVSFILDSNKNFAKDRIGNMYIVDAYCFRRISKLQRFSLNL